MLSYLIAVEVDRIIENNYELKKSNFNIELLMENSNEALPLKDKRKNDEKYRYCIRIKGNEIKFAMLSKH